MIHDRIDGVLFDADEDGLSLVLSGRDAEYRLNVQDVLEELYNAVRADVRPWILEREQARAQAVVFACDPDESAGAYDLSDPKHPDFHSVHVDHYDSREGK